MNFGIEILFKDGSKEWIDPCVELPIEKDGNLTVSNQRDDYKYSLAEVDKWSEYDLCDVCGHDVRTYDCQELCANPRIESE